jgi:hypothetical protein
MAKTAKSKKKGKGKSTTTMVVYNPRNGPKQFARKQRVPRGLPGFTADEKRLAHMLVDPCNAPLVHGSYQGVRGYITRVNRYYNIPIYAGTDQGFVAILLPSTHNSIIQSFANLGTATNFTVAQNLNGGLGFLESAQQLRCLGACLEVWSDLPALNIAGSIAWGTIPIASIPANSGSAGTFVAANIIAAGGLHMDKMTSNKLEVNWRPGAMDQYYETNNNPPWASSETGDRNAIVIVAFGLPAGSYTLRSTEIVEWVPKSTIGIAAPMHAGTTSTSSPSNVVAKLDSHKKDWWYHVGQGINAAGRAISMIESAASTYERVAPIVGAMLAI